MIKCLIKHTYTYTYITDQLITRPITLVIFSKYLPKFFYSKQIFALQNQKRSICKAVNVTKKCYNCTVGNLEIKNDKKRKLIFIRSSKTAALRKNKCFDFYHFIRSNRLRKCWCMIVMTEQ